MARASQAALKQDTIGLAQAQHESLGRAWVHTLAGRVGPAGHAQCQAVPGTSPARSGCGEGEEEEDKEPVDTVAAGRGRREEAAGLARRQRGVGGGGTGVERWRQGGGHTGWGRKGRWRELGGLESEEG